MNHKLTPKNLLLRALPEPVIEDLRSASENVHYDLEEKVMLPHEPLLFVDFPETAIISLLRPIEEAQEDDPATVEIATIGAEGFVGYSTVLGVMEVAELAFCQVEGSGWRLPVKDFVRLLKTHPELEIICNRYIATLFNMAAGNSACNKNHSIEERCARWLLLTHDRCGREKFKLTQRFLGKMLGCSRTGVNLAAGILSKAQLISYVRGTIEVLDRAGLETVTCDCYFEIRDYYKKLIGGYFVA